MLLQQFLFSKSAALQRNVNTESLSCTQLPYQPALPPFLSTAERACCVARDLTRDGERSNMKFHPLWSRMREAIAIFAVATTLKMLVIWS